MSKKSHDHKMRKMQEDSKKDIEQEGDVVPYEGTLKT